MSSTYSLGAPDRGCPGSASGPVGLGEWNVPCSAQKSCQRASISFAIAAVYRYGGMSSTGSATSLIVFATFVIRVFAAFQGPFPGHEKTPHAGGVAVLSPMIGRQHGPLRSQKARVMANSVQVDSRR